MKNIDELMLLSRNLTVLYVEDDKNLRKEMYEILNDLFSHVMMAEDGKDGLEKFLSCKKKSGEYPDIIITDINMPHISGVEFSKQVLAYHPEQLIIVLSAHNEENHLLECINIGIDAYLLKPISSDKFFQTLQRASKKIYYKKMYERYTEKLEALAYVDSMTGIANRRRFFEKANAMFSSHQINTSPISLCIVDIDKFKTLNDTFGHDMGDEVIRVFVDCVKRELGEEECFARLGGDEFILMIHRSKEESSAVVKKIREHIDNIESILERAVGFSVSIGMTNIEVDDREIDAVIKRADINLYNEKRAKQQAALCSA